MSKLLLHLASVRSDVYDDLSHNDQRFSHILPTGHPETPNGHYDTLNEQLSLYTGHSSAQVNNHGLDHPLNFTASSGTSSGKQRLGPALSARISADAN